MPKCGTARFGFFKSKTFLNGDYDIIVYTKFWTAQINNYYETKILMF